MAKKAAVKKASPKTTRTRASVAGFLAAVANEDRRRDARAVDTMLREITGEKPALWGPSIIGYGQYMNTNTLGSAPWPRIGFSPRKASLVIYIMPRLLRHAPLMKRLGKHTIGNTCLYLNRLADVDGTVLRELMTLSWQQMSEKYT